MEERCRESLLLEETDEPEKQHTAFFSKPKNDAVSEMTREQDEESRIPRSLGNFVNLSPRMILISHFYVVVTSTFRRKKRNSKGKPTRVMTI